MIQLFLSILALILGALAYPLAKRTESWLNFFDALVLVSISGLTMLHLIPHSVEALGWPAIVAALIGFGLPALFHRRSGSVQSTRLLEILALLGLVAHTLLDGMALYMGDMHEHHHEHEAGALLSLGVLLHRLPIGFFITWLLVPKRGKKSAFVVIALMAICTVLGFVMGSFAIPQLGLSGLNLLQALIAGTLLHVVFHNVSHKSVSNDASWALPSGMGAVAGVLILVFVEFAHGGHGHEEGSALLNLWHMGAQLALPLLFVSALVFALWLATQRQSTLLAHTILLHLTPRRPPRLLNAPSHLWEALGLVMIFALFDPLWSFSYLVVGLCFFSILHFVLPRAQNCECCDSYSHDLCDEVQGPRQWLYQCSSRLLVASILLATAQQISGFVQGVDLGVWELLAAACLGMLLRVQTMWRLLIAAVIALWFSPGASFIFAILSLINYDYPASLVSVLYARPRVVAYAITMLCSAAILIFGVYFVPAWALPHEDDLPQALQIGAAAAFFAFLAVLVIRRGPRAMLETALDKPQPHSHTESCPPLLQENAGAQSS